MVKLFQSYIALYLKYPKGVSGYGVILYLRVIKDRTLNINVGVLINPRVLKTLGLLFLRVIDKGAHTS